MSVAAKNIRDNHEITKGQQSIQNSQRNHDSPVNFEDKKAIRQQESQFSFV